MNVLLYINKVGRRLCLSIAISTANDILEGLDSMRGDIRRVVISERR
jgi:hypothetical protein